VVGTETESKGDLTHFHLVISKMSWVKLGGHMLKNQPTMKVLYMSGYLKRHFSQLRQRNLTADF